MKRFLNMMRKRQVKNSRYIFILFLFLGLPINSVANECIDNFVEKIDIHSIPSIVYSPGSYWFKPNTTPLEEPKYDYKYVRDKSAFDNIVTTYFFDFESDQGYIQIRGGISDVVKWYGPFKFDENVCKCLQSKNKGVRQ